MKSSSQPALLASGRVLVVTALLGAPTAPVVGCSAEGNSTEPENLPESAVPSRGSDAATPCDGCAPSPTACEPQSFCPVALDGLGVDTRAVLFDFSGTSETDVWSAGTLGTILYYDGTEWSKLHTPDVTFMQISARGGSDVLAASTLTLFFAWTPGESDEWPAARIVPQLDDAHINGMWAAPGSRWTWLAVRSAPYTSSPNSIELKRVRKSTTAFVADTPLLCQGCPRLMVMPLMDVHGSSEDDVWAVGELGVVHRVSGADGDRPTSAMYDSRTYSTLYGVWASAPNDVWAVGAGGVIRHYAGSDEQRFEIVESPVESTLRSIHGSSQTDIWAVGDRGVILHYDGHAWLRVPLSGVDDEPDLYAVWAAAPTRVWAAGRGVLLELSTGGEP